MRPILFLNRLYPAPIRALMLLSGAVFGTQGVAPANCGMDVCPMHAEDDESTLIVNMGPAIGLVGERITTELYSLIPVTSERRYTSRTGSVSGSSSAEHRGLKRTGSVSPGHTWTYSPGPGSHASSCSWLVK